MLFDRYKIGRFYKNKGYYKGVEDGIRIFVDENRIIGEQTNRSFLLEKINSQLDIYLLGIVLLISLLLLYFMHLW